MEEFIDYAKVIMGTLGHKLFEPLGKSVSNVCESNISDVVQGAVNLHLTRNIKKIGKIEANGVQTTEGFVVLQGSHIASIDDDTIPAVIKERRKRLILMRTEYYRRICCLPVLRMRQCLSLEKVLMD